MQGSDQMYKGVTADGSIKSCSSWIPASARSPGMWNAQSVICTWLLDNEAGIFVEIVGYGG